MKAVSQWPRIIDFGVTGSRQLMGISLSKNDPSSSSSRKEASDERVAKRGPLFSKIAASERVELILSIQRE